MGANGDNLHDLLQAFNGQLAQLRANGLKGFECSSEALLKLQNLEQTLAQSRTAKLKSEPHAIRQAVAQSVEAPLYAGSAFVPEQAAPVETLADIERDLGDCRRCRLCETRRNIVFGVGNPRAKLVFIGEGPGQDEDIQGIPFVGAAGQLLTKIIAAMKLSRDDVYICNVVKCRPPGNRNPNEDEVRVCIPFLERQIAAINPMFIVGLGGIAVQSLLETNTGITRLRGKWATYKGIKFMPTFHPSYLLRSPEKKRDVWEDVQQVMKLYPYDE